MGYYANGAGAIKFKSNKAMDAARKVLDGVLDNDESGTPQCLDVWFDDKYHSDEIENALSDIAKYVKEGHIDFKGEDDALWQYKFNPSTKTWDELGGTIIYGTVSGPSVANVLVVARIIKQENFKNKAGEPALPCMMIEKVCLSEAQAKQERVSLIAKLKKQNVPTPTKSVVILNSKLTE